MRGVMVHVYSGVVRVRMVMSGRCDVHVVLVVRLVVNRSDSVYRDWSVNDSWLRSSEEKVFDVLMHAHLRVRTNDFHHLNNIRVNNVLPSQF
jgi:hypothetical protein